MTALGDLGAAEQAIDDLLLSVDDVRAGILTTLTSRVSDRISDAAMPALGAYVAKHTGQRKGAQAAADAFTTATRESVVTYAALAAWLLTWASDQTGLPVAEVLERAVPDLTGGA